jgi:hypothetical protein
MDETGKIATDDQHAGHVGDNNDQVDCGEIADSILHRWSKNQVVGQGMAFALNRTMLT